MAPFLCIAMCSCVSPDEGQRAYAKNFVQSDARSDAANTADDRCGGRALLIDGRTGYSPDDYRCSEQTTHAEPVPSSYVCTMHDGSEITISVLTEMSGEVRDGTVHLRLRYPVFQSNDTQVLVSARPPAQPYLYSLFIDDMRLIRAHVAVDPEPALEGACHRK